MLPFRAGVDLGAMAMKSYSAFPKFLHIWGLITRLYSVISRTLVGGVLLLCRDTVDVF